MPTQGGGRNTKATMAAVEKIVLLNLFELAHVADGTFVGLSTRVLWIGAVGGRAETRKIVLVTRGVWPAQNPTTRYSANRC